MSFHSKFLRDIAVETPGAGAVLSRWRIDYCCEGGETLEAAAGRLGVDPAAVAADISALNPYATEPAPSRTEDLILHLIERYHRPHLRDLSEAVHLAVKVERAHRGRDDCPLGLAEHLMFMLDDLEAHQQKEEAVLFPLMLAAAGTDSIRHPVIRMMTEHQDQSCQLDELARVTRGFVAPADACRTWLRLYELCRRIDAELREHLHLENNVLFPRFLPK